MNKRNLIPMHIPNLGQNNLYNFDPSEGIDQECAACGCKTFDKILYIKRIPKIARSNKIGKDINLEIIAYSCRECGEELKIDEKKAV